MWTLVGNVMFLLFNMLSRFVIACLPRSKHLLISWLQSPSTVILEPKKIKSVTVSTFFPSTCHEVMGPAGMILTSWMLSFKPGFSFSCFTLIKRLFSSSSLSAIRVVSSAYLRLLIFPPAILIPTCESFNLAFHMIYSAYKLNKQDDNIQVWHTPFPILNQSVVSCPVLTVTSWPAYRLLRRQVRWPGITILAKGFSIVSEAEVDVFFGTPLLFLWSNRCWQFDLWFLCLFQSQLVHLKFSVDVLLKPSLKDFEYYLASMWNIRNCTVVWTFFGIAFLWDWSENWPLSVSYSILQL